MKSLSIIIAFFLTINTVLYAQNIYTTKKGHVLLMSKIGDNNVEAESHDLSLFLDYRNKTITGEINLKTFISNNKTTSKIINNEESLLVKFSGIIPDTDFMQAEHPPINFNWKVNVTFKDKSYFITLKATIQHMYQETLYSCMFSAIGEISTSDIGIKSIFPKIDDHLQVQFAQLLLLPE